MTRTAMFRVDASAQIGGGHVMRCLSLANALSLTGWRCAFACSQETKEAAPFLERSKHSIFYLDGGDLFDVGALTKIWREGTDFLVVDHYRIGASYESAARPWANQIVIIDDFDDRAHDSDILVNPAPASPENARLMAGPRNTACLFSPDHALLRHQFAQMRWRGMHRTRRDLPPFRILVSFGLGCGDGTYERTLSALAASGLSNAIDVIGPAALDFREPEGIQVRGHRLVENVAEIMGAADLAIGAAGGMSWERCCLGLPAIVCPIADNQVTLARVLKEAGAAVIADRQDAIEHRLVDIAEGKYDLRQMAEAASSVCDGLGAQRAALALAPPKSTANLPVTLRRAKMDDLDMMFKWQTMPMTRRHARNSATPTYAEHRAWFDGTLRNPSRILNVIEVSEQPAGVLRLDHLGGAVEAVSDAKKDAFEVSIFLTPKFHRQGIGTAALKACRILIPWARMEASVAEKNVASHGMFRKAGYRWNEERYVQDAGTDFAYAI